MPDEDADILTLRVLALYQKGVFLRTGSRGWANLLKGKKLSKILYSLLGIATAMKLTLIIYLTIVEDSESIIHSVLQLLEPLIVVVAGLARDVTVCAKVGLFPEGLTILDW